VQGPRSPAPGNWLGVHFALNIFIATTILWLVLRLAAGLNPIWAISSMIAASDPNVKEALRTFRGRIINAGLGCATGLFFLIVGRGGEWTSCSPRMWSVCRSCGGRRRSRRPSSSPPC
jgi:hypothetical protein